MFHTDPRMHLTEADRSQLYRASELMLPDTILTVDEVPMLATGKTDYAAVQRIVVDRLGQAEAA